MLANIKNKQYWLLLVIIAVLTIGFITVTALLLNSKKYTSTPKKNLKNNLTTGVSRVNPQEVWVHDFSAKADITQKRLEALEQTFEKIIKLNTPLQPSPNKESLLTPAENLRNDLAQSIQGPATQNAQVLQGVLPPQPEGLQLQHLGSVGKKSSFQSKSLKKIGLNLSGGRANKALKTIDNTIPAGAFAEAILLGGVDASTSIQASSDPRPVLLRITDPGTLPRRFKSDLQGCHVLAASYGDISSERVFMRLEKMSCVERRTGEVVEMNVHGYVAGEDSKAGIRGTVVDKAGANMRNAMVGGFFSSIGRFLGQARSPLLFSPATGLAETNPLSTGDILKQSAGNGVSGALDKYADFYIKRAEQMQPVIQVSADRTVDIVFTQGIEFSDSAVRKIMSKTNDQKRFQQVQNIEEGKSVQEWLPKSDGE